MDPITQLAKVGRAGAQLTNAAFAALAKAASTDAFVYLLRDEFTSDRAAPLSSPRTCEPGPGTLTVVTDANNIMSISGGQLVINGVSASETGVRSGSIAKAAGTAFFISNMLRTDISWQRMGWTDDASGIDRTPIFGAYFNGATTYRLYDGTNTLADVTVAATGELQLGFVMQSTAAGYVGLYRSGTTGPWTVLYVFSASSTSPVYAYVGMDSNSAHNMAWDNFRLLELGKYDARFATDNGLATVVTASPALNSTITHTANCLIELSGLVPSVDATSLLYRSTADDAGWRVDVNTDGNVYLQQLNAGTTQRGGVAHGVADGAAYRVVVVAEGNVHKVFVNNALKISYTDAGNFQNTATAAKVLAVGTGDTMSNLIAWPRTVTLPNI